MPVVRISTVGQERRDVPFDNGETLGSLFGRIGVDIPAASGVEVWLNGEKCENWNTYQLQDNDAVVLVPNLKGATYSLNGRNYSKPFRFRAVLRR